MATDLWVTLNVSDVAFHLLTCRRIRASLWAGVVFCAVLDEQPVQQVIKTRETLWGVLGQV
jgi:hypothetical protein